MLGGIAVLRTGRYGRFEKLLEKRFGSIVYSKKDLQFKT
jgi:hypothetical protein